MASLEVIFLNYGLDSKIFCVFPNKMNFCSWKQHVFKIHGLLLVDHALESMLVLNAGRYKGTRNLKIFSNHQFHFFLIILPSIYNLLSNDNRIVAVICHQNINPSLTRPCVAFVTLSSCDDFYKLYFKVQCLAITIHLFIHLLSHSKIFQCLLCIRHFFLGAMNMMTDPRLFPQKAYSLLTEIILENK